MTTPVKNSFSPSIHNYNEVIKTLKTSSTIQTTTMLTTFNEIKPASLQSKKEESTVPNLVSGKSTQNKKEESKHQNTKKPKLLNEEKTPSNLSMIEIKKEEIKAPVVSVDSLSDSSDDESVVQKSKMKKAADDFEQK